MKIGLVSSYPLESYGGVQSHILSQYYHLKKLNHLVKIIAPGPPTKIPEKLQQDVIRIGHSVTLPMLYGTQGTLALGMDYSEEIGSLFEHQSFDILHFHSLNIPALSWQILELSPTINIASFHTVLENNFFSVNLLQIIGEYLNRKIHGRIAISQQAEKLGQRFAPGIFEIIPNGVDTKRFSPTTSPLAKFDHNLINILFVGRVEKRKGLNFLLRIFKKLKNEGFPLRLIVVGNGSSLKTYKNFYDDPEIYFEGEVDDQALPHYYASADIFCSPALFNESFGIVLLKAMSSGKPVVAGKNPGYQELVEGKNVGFLINPKSTSEFRQALTQLIEDDNLRVQMGKNALAYAQNFAWDKIILKIEDYYQKVIKNNKPEKEAIFKIF